MENLEQFLVDLKKDIQNTKEEINKVEAIERVEEIAKNYKGEDKIVSSFEIAEQMKVKPPELKMHSSIKGLDDILDGFRQRQIIVLSGITKHGKCLAKGTDVLMFDGSIKKVEDIKIGDKLMGINSQPRNVIALGNGKEEMYKIKQRGAEYIVNKSHILSLIDSRTGEIKNISVNDWLKKSDKSQAKTFWKGWKSGVDFKESSLDIEPYFLGLWLGDGTSSNVSITNIDFEVKNYLNKYAKKIGLRLNVNEHSKKRATTLSIVGERGSKNLQSYLRKINILNNKHIPKHYLINSRKNRLELLAGILDSDGFLTKHKWNWFELVTKLPNLAKDYYFLASSLGFQVTTIIKKIDNKNYYRLRISGDIWNIPTKIKRKQAVKNLQTKHKDVMRSKIEVTPVGLGEYFGFEIDGDGLFLLGNFVVTHNTSIAVELTSRMKEYSPLWFPFEEPAEELIQKFLDRGEQPPLFFTPQKLKENSLLWIEKRILESKAKYDTKIVFIDHLHYLVSFSGENISHSIGKCMRELKKLAVKWKVAIVLLAHLKKTQLDLNPNLDDLRDSSFIGQEADTVMIMWRKTEKKNGEIIIGNEVNLSVQANRRTGKTGNVKLLFDNGKFYEKDWQHKDIDDF